MRSLHGREILNKGKLHAPLKMFCCEIKYFYLKLPSQDKIGRQSVTGKKNWSKKTNYDLEELHKLKLYMHVLIGTL